MLEADDLLRLPYDDSLTEAGVVYARHSLHYTYNRMSLQPYPRLRSIVTGVAVELAFRRWLEAQGVRYQLLGATHFTQPDHYDILLGGRRCDLKSYLVSDRGKIRALRGDPGYLLGASALVPLDQHNSDRLGPDDLYLFGFLAGLETQRRAELERVLAENQRRYLIYTLSQPEWSRPTRWDPLGRLALKSNAGQTFAVEVGGQNAQREPHREQVTLPPRTRKQTRLDYYSLLYLHLADLP
ncbi:MAG: hypothetical protein HY784_08765, partial [Chloroflexi bacterium]|nr:hypothetical protein [Chloroflexota bacterium]